MTEPTEDGRRLKFLKWLDSQMDSRPFVTAVIVMILVVTPGFVRIEQLADDSKDTADALAIQEARDDEILLENNLESCQTRNTFQQNTREKFDKFNDAVELAVLSGVTDPARLERITSFIAQLRASVETDPEDEDRDCNEDGLFDEADYLP